VARSARLGVGGAAGARQRLACAVTAIRAAVGDIQALGLRRQT